MSINPEVANRITKLEKNVEEIRDAIREQYFKDRDEYYKRIDDVLSKFKECVYIWIEIDGVKNINEIESYINKVYMEISHATFWRRYKKMEKNGLIKKIGIRDNSNIYEKKFWAKILNIDDYVRKKYL